MQPQPKSFSYYPWCHGARHELDRAFPSYLTVFDHEELDVEIEHDTHYIYIHGGEGLIETPIGSFRLKPGMFCVQNGPYRITGAQGISVSRESYDGYFQIGGPVEYKGRLKYIDGCTDSLLSSPARWGDPCLNLLYFPSGIDQTMHTHPSDRIGMILSGRGECVTPDEIIPLLPGMIFCIHTDGPHKFRTMSGSDMRVLAYHPDSDFGPRDEEHPMLNRTIVDGVSARFIEKIRTK